MGIWGLWGLGSAVVVYGATASTPHLEKLELGPGFLDPNLTSGAYLFW